MNLIHRIKYSQNWNIGFCKQTPEELIQNKALKPVQWMKHPYRDRWFADPFILKETEDEIVVFVEECPMENPKGILCELVLDKKTKRLKQRFVLLELDTHLSYPAIIRYDGKIYVYPENGASGQLNIYEYDSVSHKLINPVCILDEAVADATILYHQGQFMMLATKYPKTQEEVFLYESESLFGPFVQIGEKPIQSSRSCSRPGGGWFFANGQLFRPAQNCLERYGFALSLMSVEKNNAIFQEKIAFSILPHSYQYSEGLHTINFLRDMCVVDGCGYYYSYAKPFIKFIRMFKRFACL